MAILRNPRMPTFGGATGWLNSEPLGADELRGRVVVVDFWTLTCINWLRTEPYVRAWSQAYRDDGLTVIGVHTPEFSFEHERDRVELATKEMKIDYPVALDNAYGVWEAFDNHYWPALYFVDKDGVIRDMHFGEGRYEESERVIQRLLGVERGLVSVRGEGVEAEADWDNLRSPETYLGYSRRERLGAPAGLQVNQWGLGVSGRAAQRTLCSSGAAAASPTAFMRVTRIWSSHTGRASRFRSVSCSTASPPGAHTESTSTSRATACSTPDACTSSSASATPCVTVPSRSRFPSGVLRPTSSRSASSDALHDR